MSPVISQTKHWDVSLIDPAHAECASSIREDDVVKANNAAFPQRWESLSTGPSQYVGVGILPS